MLSDWAVNETDDSRFGVWARKTKEWIEQHYRREGVIPVGSDKFELFVRPALYQLAGRRRLFPPTWQARAMEDLRKKTGRREFKRGILAYRDGGWNAVPFPPDYGGMGLPVTAAHVRSESAHTGHG